MQQANSYFLWVLWQRKRLQRTPTPNSRWQTAFFSRPLTDSDNDIDIDPYKTKQHVSNPGFMDHYGTSRHDQHIRTVHLLHSAHVRGDHLRFAGGQNSPERDHARNCWTAFEVVGGPHWCGTASSRAPLMSYCLHHCTVHTRSFNESIHWLPFDTCIRVFPYLVCIILIRFRE